MSMKPNWIDRSAWIAEQMLINFFPHHPDLQPERTDGEGSLELPHLLFMALELKYYHLDSETKACRWLGWLQAGLVALKLATLEDMKQLNLRSGTECGPSLQTLRTESEPATLFGGPQRYILTRGLLKGVPALFFEPIPDHLAKPVGTIENIPDEGSFKLTPGTVAVVLQEPAAAETVRAILDEAIQAYYPKASSSRVAQPAATPGAALKPCPWEEPHLCCYPNCNCAPERETVNAATPGVAFPEDPTPEMEKAFEQAYWAKQSDISSPTPTEHPDDGGGAFGYGYRAMRKAALAAALAPDPAIPGPGAGDGTGTHPPRDLSKMAEGCCSACSPCSHQKHDPYSICEVCQKAAAIGQERSRRDERHYALAKDAAERAAKNAKVAPELLFAPILWAIQDVATRPAQPAATPGAEGGLREAATRLIDRLDRVHDHPAYRSVWAINQLHAGPYCGPKYEDELDALRAAIASAPEQGVALPASTNRVAHLAGGLELAAMVLTKLGKEASAGSCTDAAVHLRSTIEQPGQPDFQARNQAWLNEVTKDDPTDLAERRDRFLEEALELVQSLGMTLDDVDALTGYVFDRPIGVPAQEMGGTYVTMAALAEFAGLDMVECGERELRRVNKPEVIAKVIAKRAGRHGRGPLPGTDPKVD